MSREEFEKARDEYTEKTLIKHRLIMEYRNS